MSVLSPDTVDGRLPKPSRVCIDCGAPVRTFKEATGGQIKGVKKSALQAGRWRWPMRCRSCSMKEAHKRRPGAWGTKTRTAQ